MSSSFAESKKSIGRRKNNKNKMACIKERAYPQRIRLGKAIGKFPVAFLFARDDSSHLYAYLINPMNKIRISQKNDGAVRNLPV